MGLHLFCPRHGLPWSKQASGQFSNWLLRTSPPWVPQPTGADNKLPMIKHPAFQLLSFFIAATISTAALAVNTPLVENFDADAANWLGGDGTVLSFSAGGGPDGSSYVSSTFSFLDTEEDDSAVVVRARTISGPIASSDGAFFGNWVNDGVSLFSVEVRHDAPVPLSYFARFAGPVNFPGGIGIQFAPVLPNTWTELEWAIDATNPQFVSFEGQTFEDVFSNVGRIQLGVSTPAALAGMDVDVAFDIDQATALPEPTTAMMVLLSAAGLLTARHRQSNRNGS